MNNYIEYKNELLGEKYFKTVHKSGLTVIVFPKERQSSNAFLLTEFGSIDNRFYNEKTGRLTKLPDGIAHFMEHKMFDNEGGESVEDIFSRFGGDPNAYTCWDHTAYFFTSPSGEPFYEGLDNLIRFVYEPYFTRKSVKKEQGIIGQEIAEGDDSPFDRCFMGMVEGLYEKHPARIDVAGTAESIAKITPKTLYDCHERFYTPSNMTLVVCGVAEFNRVMDLVDKHLGDRAPREKLVRYYPRERKTVYKREVTRRMAVERAIFCIGFKDSKIPDDPYELMKRNEMAGMLMGIIFSSSGELYNSLFKRGIMTTHFNYGTDYGKTYAVANVSGECDDTERLFSEIRKYIKKLKKNGIDKDDFERRKKIIYSSDIRMFDSTWSVANALVCSEVMDAELFEVTEAVKNITLDEMNAFLRELIAEKYTTYSVVLPNERT